jgi:hypothetical protein
MAIKRAVVKVTRVAGKDEGNGKGHKSNGNGIKEGDCKEESNCEQCQKQDDDARDEDSDHNNNGNEYNDDNDDTHKDGKDNDKYDYTNGAAVAVAGGDWRWWGRAM